MITTSWMKAFEDRNDKVKKLGWSIINEYLEYPKDETTLDKDINIQLIIDGKEYDIYNFLNFYTDNLDDFIKDEARNLIDTKMDKLMDKMNNLREAIGEAVNETFSFTNDAFYRDRDND